MGVYIIQNSTAKRVDGSPSAAGVAYNNGTSGLSATDAQGAIDEVNRNITRKVYSVTFEENDVVSSEMQGIYISSVMLDLDSDIALYGQPISINTKGMGGIPMPSTYYYSNAQHKWIAIAIGSPNTVSGEIIISYAKKLVNV